ncbi:MAG: transglutaminase domain-containing protein [Clostridiales bacterium]|nr:transglutaminase domain-containing protein [Clostridiales bacterium]
MKKNSAVLIDFLYHFLNAGVLACAVILCFFDFFGIADITWRHYIVLLFSIILLFLIKRLNIRQQIYILLLGTLIAALLFIIIGREKCLSWILAQKDLVWTFAVTVIVCIWQILMEKRAALRKTTVIILLVWLIYALFSKQQVHKMGVAFLLMYAVEAMTEFIHFAWKKVKNEHFYSFILWITPFLALYFGLLCLAPAPDTSYSWQWAKDIYHNVEEKITMCLENFMNGKREDMENAVSGFSGEANLFSNVSVGERQIMTIATLDTRNLPFYLTGKVYDSFDGREWVSLNQNSGDERLFDTVETAYALERYANNGEGNYYKNINLEVNYQQFHTNYLLAPSKTWSVQGTENKISYHQSGADLIFDKKAGYGTGYLLKFCHLNMDREMLYDFLLTELKEDEMIWEKTVYRYAGMDIAADDLNAYRENIQAQYLKEVVDSPQVEEWLVSVTQYAENDVEKLFYIEEELAGMSYNTNPGSLPDEITDAQSFLEYFLLEKQEGYCSYFATTFVLLARMEGFPARYVQGFCIPTGNEKETAVYSSMAHAWPEVYIEGKGWIPFEPTPEYRNRRYATWEIKTDKKDDYVNHNWTTPKEDISAEAEYTEETDEADYEKKERLRWVKYVLWGALLIMIISILAFAIDKVSEKRREKKRSLSQKYKAAVLRNLQILAMLGYERADSETYHEFLERIELSKDGSYIITAFIETYESILYGNREIGAAELEECLEQQKALIQALRINKGRKYIFYRMKLYIM